MLATGGSISADVRNSAAQRLRTMGVGALIAHLYPVMFALHDLDLNVGIADETTGWIPLPPYLRPTYMSMEANGVYLAGIFVRFWRGPVFIFVNKVATDNGNSSILWIGRLASSRLVVELFGKDSIDLLSSSVSARIIVLLLFSLSTKRHTDADSTWLSHLYPGAEYPSRARE